MGASTPYRRLNQQDPVAVAQIRACLGVPVDLIVEDAQGKQRMPLLASEQIIPELLVTRELSITC
jgi:hypothetical protein